MQADDKSVSRIDRECLSDGQDLRVVRHEAVRLFIPLRSEFYEAFANGTKTEELRRYGPRWNERTCAVGRRVVLSRGYGKAQRLTGRIWKFKKQHGSTFGSTYKASIERIYGTLEVNIACISIELDQPTREKGVSDV